MQLSEQQKHSFGRFLQQQFSLLQPSFLFCHCSFGWRRLEKSALRKTHDLVHELRTRPHVDQYYSNSAPWIGSMPLLETAEWSSLCQCCPGAHGPSRVRKHVKISWTSHRLCASKSSLAVASTDSSLTSGLIPGVTPSDCTGTSRVSSSTFTFCCSHSSLPYSSSSLGRAVLADNCEALKVSSDIAMALKKKHYLWKKKNVAKWVVLKCHLLFDPLPLLGRPLLSFLIVSWRLTAMCWHRFSTSASDSGLDIFVICTTANEKQLAITDDGIGKYHPSAWPNPFSAQYIAYHHCTNHRRLQLQKGLLNETKISSNAPQQASSTENGPLTLTNPHFEFVLPICVPLCSLGSTKGSGLTNGVACLNVVPPIPVA